MDDVDLSLMKTRSATKRAKRASSSENQNSPASNVVSSADAAPEAPTAPAAFEGPVASTAKSSAQKRVNHETRMLLFRLIMSLRYQMIMLLLRSVN